MKVFVIGKLGELVKKIIELEDIVLKHPDNVILVAELIAYNQVLEIWPTDDTNAVYFATQNLRLCLAKLQQEEKELRSPASTASISTIYIDSYLKTLDAVRQCITQLNSLGKFVGDSPWMDIDDTKLEQTTAQDNSSGGNS